LGDVSKRRYLQEVDREAQLKPTVNKLTERNGYLSYSFAGPQHYDDLRSDNVVIPRKLVGLFLPKDRDKCLTNTKLTLPPDKCPYWVTFPTISCN
jgi:hypothetical protein